LAKAAFDVDTLNAALVSKAMAQYLRTITSFQSRLDTFLASTDSTLLSNTELKGISIFKAHCATCHPHPLYTDLDFHHIVHYNTSDGADNRRALVSRKIADTCKIKTPTLRNLKYTYPYGHTGKFSTLYEIIRAHRLSTVFNDEQLEHLVIFLNTLNDNSLINSPY
jgi:cytochrome c peroxidase